MITQGHNLLADLPASLPPELVETLLATATFRVERIVSLGHASAEGFWYDQDHHEWVLLLSGAARLRIEDREAIELTAGSALNIPARRRHRVEWTSSDVPTVWLAIHYYAAPGASSAPTEGCMTMSSDGGKVEQDPRVIFAAERTLLAWIRTGLALMGFGFVVARFGLFLRELTPARNFEQLPPPPSHGSLWIGVVLVVLGVTMNLIATISHIGTMRKLRLGAPITPAAWSAATLLAVLLAGLGVAMAMYLLAMR